MERFEERVLAACKELLAPGDRVIAAVSGGADSMALLQFLLEYKDALGVGVEAVHVDHRMRADSARDAAFVAKFCQKNGVPLHAFAAAAPPARPSEEWCRELRYGFFETLAAPGVKIATAHTLSDQAETLLLRLARGPGCGARRASPPCAGASCGPCWRSPRPRRRISAAAGALHGSPTRAIFPTTMPATGCAATRCPPSRRPAPGPKRPLGILRPHGRACAIFAGPGEHLLMSAAAGPDAWRLDALAAAPKTERKRPCAF